MNRLQHETSPYLKQHAENPVDWYPWGEEALALAKKLDKPILLSVGYSACHWCHVMAHECFENPMVASIMNEHFVNIKVDREERPDLDQIYQTVAQIMTQGGGWPLTVMLTPDLKPFYGGTYFPPVDKYGRPGFPRLILSLSKAYQNDRGSVLERAEKLTDVIRNHQDWDDPKLRSQKPVESAGTRELLLTAARTLASHLDWQNGGVGAAPKFPNVSALSFLWRMSLPSWVPPEDRDSFREGVRLALEKMRRGGIFDQIAGGFHRYAVDATWSVPHFEKMLYDNGLLLKLYAEVLLNDQGLSDGQRGLYTSAIEKTVGYLSREMVSPQGLFYAAQDADSEGEEGKYFVWTPNEIQKILGAENGKRFCEAYGVTESGNFEHGTTVLHLCLTDPKFLADLSALEKTLLNEREKRIHPGLDDKSLTAWNALMISGLSWSALALRASGKDESANLAEKMAKNAYQGVKKLASQKDGRLYATVQAGAGKFNGYLDDYAFMAKAASDLARMDSAQSSDCWSDAKTWIQTAMKLFSEKESPGFYFTAQDHESLIHRPKSLFDQAIPSGSGVLYELLAVLAADGDSVAEAKLNQDQMALKDVAAENSFGMSEALSSFLLQEIQPVVVKGVPSLEVLGHPFCFVTEFKANEKTVQFCHKQVCVLDSIELKKIF